MLHNMCEQERHEAQMKQWDWHAKRLTASGIAWDKAGQEQAAADGGRIVYLNPDGKRVQDALFTLVKRMKPADWRPHAVG